MPSFHAECSLSLVERSAGAELVVRVPSRPVWSGLAARAGATTGDPAADRGRPAVSAERVPALAPGAIGTWRAVADALAGARPPERSVIGLDGMSVDARLWSPSLELSFSLWFGAFDGADARHRLVRAAVEIAAGAARGKRSVAALRDIAAYLDGTAAAAR